MKQPIDAPEGLYSVPCCEKPLTECLRSVPELARVLVEDPCCSGTRSIPVGVYCQKAANEIQCLLRLVDSQQLEIGRLTSPPCVQPPKRICSKAVASRNEVYRAIDSERDYQNALGCDRVEKWEVPHTTGEELSLIATYLRRAQDAYADRPGDAAALEVVRKIAGMCVRCMENHGAPSRQPVKGVVCSPHPESDLNDPRCRGSLESTRRADRPS